MKSAKKILALILAGVMALALLTGCGKAASLDRTMAEGMAEFLKLEFAQYGNKNNISVSYQVPELSRNIAPLFDENWVKQSEDGDPVLNDEHTINGETIQKTLEDILSPYESASYVDFIVADVTDVKTPLAETLKLATSQIRLSIYGEDFDQNSPTSNFVSITSLKVAVTHKTVNGHTYALCVAIAEK